jgi:phage/plasmid-like protein (TIGR03299 family)
MAKQVVCKLSQKNSSQKGVRKMSHQIESIAWHGERPWHGLGTEVLNCMTSAEAIIAAGLDWEVEKKEIFTKDGLSVDESGVQTPSEKMVVVPGYYAVVRKTDASPLGVVGERYTPLQNKDAFAFFDEVVGTYDAIYETAGSLRGGKVIWIMSKLPGHVGWSEDPIEEWLVLSNAHDGSRQLVLMATPVRVVCSNTLNVALQSAKVNFEVRHTSGMMDRVVDAREALGIATDYFKEMDAVVKALKEYRMSEQEIKSYVHNLFPLKVRADESLSGFEDTINVEISPRVKKYIEKVFELVQTGRGTEIPGVKGSAYGAFNAAVEFADHYQPVKGKSELLSRKLDSVWFGSAARFKQQAFDQICDTVQL